jgi:A118 family predicted phage portal protein
MPLPERDETWPPTPPEVQSALADWSAWYSADPDRLQDRYVGRVTGEPRDRPSQHRGGVVGRLARWFWGNPTPEGEKRTKLHVPLAGDISRVSADLLFSEPPALTVDSTATQDRLTEMIEEGLHAALIEAAEVCSALGGVYLRLVWDKTVADRPWIEPVHADNAVPEFRYGRLSAVTFWRVISQDGRTWIRHLERHEPGAILHGLYQGSPGQLGKRIPLSSDPSTEGLPPSGVLLTGTRLLTAAYIPNIRPARAWRHCPGAAGLGQSDYQGIESILDALDETYSSWMRDVRNGAGRVVVPASMLNSEGPGEGASWNIDKQIYTGLNILPRAGDPNPLTVVQFDIRVAEHRDTCRELMEQAVRQAGYATGTFGLSDDGTAVTATEIRARNARTMSTRGRKVLPWNPELRRLITAQLEVETKLFGAQDLDPEGLRVEFQDSIQEDPQTLANTAELLLRAESASRETRVRLVNPSWDDDQVRAEVAAIEAEIGAAVADPTMIGADILPDMPAEPGAETEQVPEFAGGE